MSRRAIQVFNMSFLDMMTNFLGAVIILFLLAAQQMGEIPFKSVKGTAKVVYNEATKKINGPIDPKILNTLKPGDTLLVIIDKTINEQEKKPEPNQNIVYPTQRQPTYEQGPDDDEMIIKKDEFEKLRKNPTPDKCLILPTIVSTSPCNDNGTPDNPDDDTYTIDIKVAGAGKCGTLWRDDQGAMMAYDKVKRYTFKIKDKTKKITYTDYTNKDFQGSITFNPPAPCTVAEGPKQPSPDIQPPPGVNFTIEFDESTGSNVDLYVEKEGQWVCGKKDGRSRSNKNIGDWSDDKTNVTWLVKTKSGIEKVHQNQAIPGTYKVYAHFKSASKEAPATSIPVKLVVSSRQSNQGKIFNFKSVPLTSTAPPNGGGMLLRTITVLPNGSLKF